MRYAAQKMVSWVLLLTGATTFLFFVLLCLYEGLPSGKDAAWYIWPVCSFLLTACMVPCLRWLYRRERSAARGRWQLSLRDLLFISLFAGLFFAAWSVCSTETFAFMGVSCGLSASLALTLGMLAASRSGFCGFPWKHIYAVGVVLRWFGYVGLTLFLGLTIISTIAGRSDQFVSCVFTPTRHDEYPFLFTPIRLSIPVLLLGLFLCRLALRAFPAGALSTGEPKSAGTEGTA